MEIITRQYNVYDFKELKPEVKEKVLDKLRTQEMESDFWYQTELDCISEELNEEYGIQVKPSNLYFDIYRGWFAMGNESRIIDTKKFLKKVVDNKVLLAQTISNPDWNFNYVNVQIENDRNGEGNWISVSCNGYDFEDELGDDEDEYKRILEEELQINLDTTIDDINKKMLNRLREQQDYTGSEEYLIGQIEDRELKFLEDGSIFI